MKYEFHAWDYIECRNGSIGYLTKEETWYSGTVGNDVVHLQGSTTVDASCGFTPFTITIPLSDVSKYFNRIGQYDFTKKDEGKIEKIDVKKAGSVFTRYETAIIDTISNKINELVEAVNQLEEEINEMGQS